MCQNFLKQVGPNVNVQIFRQCIFSCISLRALDARKYNVSEKNNHYRLNRNTYLMREKKFTRKCLMGLDARKFSCTKRSTFTVVIGVYRQSMCDLKSLFFTLLDSLFYKES